MPAVEDEELVSFTAREAFGALQGIWHFVRPVLRNYRFAAACIGLGLLTETLFNVIMPLSLKYLIDDALGQEDFRALYTILGVLAAAGIGTSLVAVWYQRWDARTSADIVADVRSLLFEHLLSLPAAFHGRTRHGDILSRFSVDMAAFEGTIKHVVYAALLPLLEVLAGIALLFWLNWQMATIAVLILPITLIGPRLVTPRAVKANYDQKVAESATLGVVQEAVAAQLVLRSFNLRRVAQGWFSRRNRDTRRTMASASFLSAMVERTVTIAVLLLHLVVLGIGAYLATRGRISIGTFVTFESAFWEVSYNIAHLTQFMPEAIQAAAATRHMQELLEEPVAAPDPPGAPDLPRIHRAIAFEGIRFRHEGSETDVFAGLDLTIQAGQRVAIVGASGAGKTTLLHLIQRLHEPTAGRVTADGVDIRTVTRDSLRACMAVVFQDSMLFATSIRENIRLGKQGASDEEVIEAARNAEVHDYVSSLPRGYDTLVGERGDTLSGGQRQRIAIARALVRDPSVLLLDEATSALDPTTEAAIGRTLRRISRDRTVISATHRLASVVDMDEIIVVGEGRVLERGSHAELLNEQGAYAALWND